MTLRVQQVGIDDSLTTTAAHVPGREGAEPRQGRKVDDPNPITPGPDNERVYSSEVQQRWQRSQPRGDRTGLVASIRSLIHPLLPAVRIERIMRVATQLRLGQAPATAAVLRPSSPTVRGGKFVR